MISAVGIELARTVTLEHWKVDQTVLLLSDGRYFATSRVVRVFDDGATMDTTIVDTTLADTLAEAETVMQGLGDAQVERLAKADCL